jgi:N-acetyl-anhydromuramyl-L-alanine amidase AmpD
MLIDDKTYKLKKTNYYHVEYQKTQIVVGHSSRKDMRHVESWLNRRNGNYKKTSAFTIDKNGKVYQHFDPKYYSDFLLNEQDKCNISITLVNEGWLTIDDNNNFVDWLGHIYSKNVDFTEISWRDYRYWVNYTEEQYESLKELLNYLCDEFTINNDIMPNNVYDENVDIFKGITFRSNYYQELTDVSPAFKINKIIS